MVDTTDSKSVAFGRGGSSPPIGTTLYQPIHIYFYLLGLAVCLTCRKFIYTIQILNFFGYNPVKNIKNYKMLITRASEYAILSLIVLSKADLPMDSESLANQLSISKSFLAKILQSLAKSGILKSYKGVKGGFVLVQDPKEINMLTVMSAVEGKAPAVFDCSPSLTSCPSNKASLCSLWPFLNKLQYKIDIFLAALTLADILEE